MNFSFNQLSKLMRINLKFFVFVFVFLMQFPEDQGYSKMDSLLQVQNSTLDPAELNSEDLQLRVDFFRKLGYSQAEVKAALKKLGLGTDTNSVLGELVQSRIGSSTGGDEKSAVPKDPLLPPSWVQGPSRITAPLGDRNNRDFGLRPIVIDGSNVAIR